MVRGRSTGGREGLCRTACHSLTHGVVVSTNTCAGQKCLSKSCPCAMRMIDAPAPPLDWQSCISNCRCTSTSTKKDDAPTKTAHTSCSRHLTPACLAPCTAAAAVGRSHAPHVIPMSRPAALQLLGRATSPHTLASSTILLTRPQAVTGCFTTTWCLSSEASCQGVCCRWPGRLQRKT